MTDIWEAPGPGSWVRDDVHFDRAMTGYLAALFPPAFREGWHRGFARYGLPLEELEPAVVRGRMFARPRPVGAPEPKPGKVPAPPPKPIMRMLFALHPELRRRRRAAATTLATKRWRTDRVAWRSTAGPQLRSRCVELQKVDPAALDVGGLADHLHALEILFHDGNVAHFDQNPASGIPVGDLLVQVSDWTGAGFAEISTALQGHSASSAETLAAVDEVAAAVRADTQAATALRDEGLTPEERLAALRDSPTASAALEAYLAEFGDRIVTGFDVTDHRLVELPGVIVASILARLEPPSPTDAAAAGDAAAEELRGRVPPDHRPAFDVLLAEARAGYALHDEDVGYCYTWPLGLLRRALLVAGQRLVALGALHQTDDVFQAAPAEVATLLGVRAPAPTADELARRAREREDWTEEEPPDHLGPEGAMPDAALFPAPVARITRALMAYVADANFARPAVTAGGGVAAAGLGASPGCYEGRARVLTGPEQFSRLEVGDVLVAPVTSPAYNAVLPLIGAVVTDKCGALCHAAIVAREFGIPAVVGTVSATRRIPDGAKVRVDGSSGVVTIVG